MLVAILLLAGGLQAPQDGGHAAPGTPQDRAQSATLPEMHGAHVAATALRGLEGQADATDLSIWIVSGPGATDADLVAALREVAEVHVYERLGMLAILAPPRVVEALDSAGFDVHRNEVYELHLDQSVPYIHADRVKEVVGLQRDGPTVLVIDTGIDSLHPDFVPGENLAANVAAKRSPNGLVAGYADDLPVADMAGHGSHVAGIVAGLGNALGSADSRNGRYMGAYSNGRVASFQASTSAADPDDIGVDLQAALEGFEWALQNHERLDIRAITNSWGSPGAPKATEPVAMASLRAYAAGMTVFFSAGNEGSPGTLNRHCLVPWVMCVASGGLDGTRSGFSSMGNPPSGALGPFDHPDITAPGSAIRSAEPTQAGAGSLLSGGEPLYRDRSGTSMAAPHGAAVAGLLQAANPDLSPDQVMDVLVATADPMSEEVWQVGAGYIDAQAAYNLAVQTLGVRKGFLAGDGVKYGGPATGDPGLAADPVSVGYDSQSGGALDADLLHDPPPKAWLLGSWVGWALLGLAAASVLAGLDWRQAPRQEPARGPAGQRHT